jgi:signal transduction histidine kinase
MISDAKRAADIIDRVRSLYQKGTFKREPVDVNDIIRGVVPLLGDLAAQDSVSVHTKLDPELPMVSVDFVQLQQVLINLMINGIEAMHNAGGELTVSSRTAEDGQILVSVSDTGIGLPAGGIDHVFEAFFTTKPEGTGLGLSISRTIVELHGGRLWAGANAGRGATFQFTLPPTDLSE